MENHSHGQFSLFATSSGASVFWIFDQLWRNGPSWSLVPAIVVAVTGLVGALNAAANDRHKRRVERLQLEARLNRFSFDQLEAKGH